LPRDPRLAAVLGVAEVIEKGIAEHFAVRVWEGNLPYGLLWYHPHKIDDIANSRGCPEHLRGPERLSGRIVPTAFVSKYP
jgi:hypothetical protein